MDNTNTEESTTGRIKSLGGELPINIPGAIATGVLILVFVLVFDIDSIKQMIASAGIWAPLLFMLLKASTIIIAPLSGAPLYPLVGIFFGFYPGILYAIAGDFIGYTTAFFISRTFGRPFVERIISKNEKGLLSNIVDHVGTVRGFLHMCMTCFALPELIAYGTGLSKLAYWKFILILWPASSIAAAVLVYIGSHIGTSDKSYVLSVGGLLLAGTVMLSGIWFFFRSVKKKYQSIEHQSTAEKEKGQN